MPRSYATPNLQTSPTLQASSAPDGTNPAVVGTIPTADQRAARQNLVSVTHAQDAQIDATVGNMQQADAQRAFPRARTDSLNPDSGRQLTPVGETVEAPSVYSHRMNRRNANRGINQFNSAQARSMSAFIDPQTDEDRQIRDDLNSFLESGGDINNLGRNTRAYMNRIDQGIQKVERHNDRNHVVYTSLSLENDNVTPGEFMSRMRGNPDARQTLLGYTRANHNPNALNADDNTALVQIETARGMYVGGEGSTGHLLPRGLELEFVSAGEFDIDDGQGGSTRRNVIQMREVRQNERTTARR